MSRGAMTSEKTPMTTVIGSDREERESGFGRAEIGYQLEVEAE